jgi:hypothetical protein
VRLEFGVGRGGKQRRGQRGGQTEAIGHLGFSGKIGQEGIGGG